MRKGRLKRNRYSVATFFLLLIAGIEIRFTPFDICNYTNVMEGSLSFASIATSLLFACFSLIPAFPNSKFIKILKQMKTDVKIMDRLLLASSLFFSTAILSLICLFFSEFDDSFISTLFVSLWLATIVTGVLEVIQIIRILFQTLENSNE